MNYYSKIGIELGGITESLNDKADRDLRNVDTISGADTVIEYQIPTAQNNYTWYRLYKSGWVEQGGRAEFSATSPTVWYVDLPVTMADDNYTVVGINNMTSSGTGSYAVGLNSRSTTRIEFRGPNASSTPYNCWNWEVKGMAA